LCVTRKELDKTGFVMDFKDIDRILKNITDLLDHKDLNALEQFSEINPTAENIACFIFNEAKKELSAIDSRISVSKVYVWESERSCASVEA